MRTGSFLVALLLVLTVSLSAFAIEVTRFSQPPDLYAEAAILMDADTGQILYGKAEHQRMYPASLTKIMTCLLAMEYGKYNDIVTIREEATQGIAGTTHIALTEGEQLTLEQLLYATMLESANDAASSIGIHLAGSIKMFSERMNERAAALGAGSSHFVNANGLPDQNHYSTAYDLALITREALKHSEFQTFAGTHQYTIPATNKNKDSRVVTHRNYMFVLNKTYEGAFAGKTGWTEEAGKCLMTIAKRNGVTLICIVLKCSGAVDAEFLDSTALFDYGFEHFRRVRVPWSRFPSQQVSYTGSEGNEYQGRLYPAFDATDDMPVLLADGVDESDLIPTTFLPQPLTEQDLSRIRFELRLPEVAGEVQDRLAGSFPVEVRPLDVEAEIGVTESGAVPFPWLLLGQILLIGLAVLLLLSLFGFWLAGRLARMYYRSYFNTRHPQTSPESEILYLLSRNAPTEQEWEEFRKCYLKQFRLFGTSWDDVEILFQVYRAAHATKHEKYRPAGSKRKKQPSLQAKTPQPAPEPEERSPVAAAPRRQQGGRKGMPNRAHRPFDK